MKCRNLPCSKEFTPRRSDQVYCCANCRSGAGLRKRRNATPEAKAENRKRLGLITPESKKKARDNAARKAYSKGRIPPWWRS